MDRRRWILSLLIVISAVLITDYLFWHYIFTPKKAALELNLEEEVEEKLIEESPLPPSELPLQQSAPPDSSSNRSPLRERIEACEEFREQNLDQLVEALGEKGISQSWVSIENWRILRPDGREQRVMVIPAEGENTKESKEVRFFDVDAEGLPIPLPLDRTKALNPTAEFLDSLKNPGQIIAHNQSQEVAYVDGTQALIKWSNNRVQELQIRTSQQKSLACQNQSCRCL